MELWDIYNKNRDKTGRLAERGGVLGENEYHLVVHVCIFNSKNEMLIQQRQPWKEGWPNLWDITVGGSALAGEGSVEAAEREVFEEIGYKVELSEERPFFTMNFSVGFNDFYLIEREIDIGELTLQYEEVQAVKWASKEEVMRLLNEGKFIDYYFLEQLFEMVKHRGAIRS